MMVFDQFVPLQYVLELRNTMHGNRFDWYYQENTVFDKRIAEQCVVKSPYKETPYYQHIFCKEDHVSERIDLVKPIFYFFEHRTGYTIKNVIRCMANAMSPQNENYMGIPHVDTYTFSGDNSKLKTLLYYVNESDGNTVLFKEKWQQGIQPSLTVDQISEPVMGKAIVFDSYRYHCASSPTKGRRMVINFIFEVE